MPGDSTVGLFEAIRAGDLGRVTALLAGDPSLVRARAPGGETPLLLACYRRLPALVGILRARGAALDMFEKALAASEARGSPTQQRIAKWAVARCLRSLGRHDEALARQLALRDAPNLGGSNDGYVFEEIGENLLVLQRKDDARINFARAYELLQDDAYLQANEAPRLARLRDLGRAP